MTTGPYRVEEVEDAGDAACTCENCDWKGAADKTVEIHSCALTPGDDSPVGRCAECDGLVYLDKPLRGPAPSSAVRTEVIERIVKQCGDDLWGDCAQFGKEDWRHEVESGDTILGYWEWVFSQAEANDVEVGTLLGSKERNQ